MYTPLLDDAITKVDVGLHRGSSVTLFVDGCPASGEAAASSCPSALVGKRVTLTAGLPDGKGPAFSGMAMRSTSDVRVVAEITYLQRGIVPKLGKESEAGKSVDAITAYTAVEIELSGIFPSAVAVSKHVFIHIKDATEGMLLYQESKAVRRRPRGNIDLCTVAGDVQS